MAMKVHSFVHLVVRAFDGMRRRPWLHLLSVFTLTAAFLSFSATLTAAINLDNLLSRWVGSAELTAYLAEGAGETELSRLAEAIEGIDGVARVETVTQAGAQKRFVRDLGAFGDMASTLPSTAFPASLDVHLAGSTARDPAARRALAGRLQKVESIQEVELYDDWFERLSALSLVGRLAVWGLGILALTVAILVVAAVVRSGVNARAREIKVLVLIGATRRYVQFPFLLEGALETTVAMLLALLGLHFLGNTTAELTAEIMPLVGGATLARPTQFVLFLLVGGSAMVGIVGAKISLKGLARA